jgi:PKD repeat protein
MMNRLKSGLIVGVVLWMGALPLTAQTYQTMHNGMNNWYFGNTPKALEFNRISKIPTVETGKFTPFGTGGGATASNPGNGNLMFYTDGANVYDAYNQVMPNGSGLLGNPSSNQPVAICPVPGQPNKYFIFTNTATNSASGSISYEVVDMAQLGNSLFPSIVPQGDLEAPLHTAVAGLTGRAEAMTIIPHSNGTDYWLLTQQASSNSYTATLINAASYNITHTGVFVSTTTTGPGLTMTASHFAAFGNNIAVAPTTANMDAIILTFVEGSSSFVLNRTIVNSASAATNGQSIYDIEWSGDGHYVYYSIFGDAGVPGNVFQYDFTAPLTTLVSALPATVFRSYGLQLAPDSTMYHIYQAAGGGPFLIGRFNDPDSVASLVNYETLPLDNTDWAATQFPALLPVIEPVIAVSFTTAGNCQNSATSFYPTVTPAADSLVWDFGDGNPPVNAWSPVHTYQNAGPVNATVTAFYQGQSQVSAPVAINITAFPLQLNLVADTTACTFEFPPPVGTSGPPPFSVTATVQGGTATSSLWSNGDIGLTLTPDSAGYYYLVIGDGSGCTAYAGVNVKEYGVTDQRANVWYFGNLAGIDFNQTPAVALNDGAMNAPEGCSAMSDRNGEIIFYTDGNNVYDQDHTQIATGIGGNTAATQSVLIVPVPGDETLYYIFTTEANSDYPSNTVYYSLFDLKQNSGKGAVVQAHIPLYSGSTERLASNGNWLITHEYGNNSFRCYPISALGIGEAVITSIGSDHAYTDPTLAEGYMKISPSSVVAVPISIPGTSNFIEVFDFVDSTGVLTNFRSVDLQETTAQVYGIEFSGDKMFATLTGPPSFIREVYFDFENNPVLIPPVAANSGPFSEELGAIQMAPDGQIYIAINGSTSLGTFTVNPDTLQLSTVNMAGFALAGGTSSNLGLPSFVQSQGNAFGGPAMTVAGVCLGSPTDYIATPTDPIDVFLWGFGDGATSNAESGQHTYGAAGPYTITLNMTNRCGLDTLMSQSITIVTPPAPPTLAPTGAICTTPVTLNANGGVSTGLTFLWNTGATTEAVTVNSIGTYSVTITDAFGCTSDGQTNMLDARPPVNLGPDQTVCEGSVVATLNAQNPPPSFSHVWTLDGVANGNSTPTQVVSTVTPGTDIYQVTVTNIATGCQTIEAVSFTITESPNFTLTPTDAVAPCGSASGSIALNITPLTATIQPPIHAFSYFVSGPVSSSVFSQPVGLYPINSLSSGTYSVVVQDDISGCAIVQTAIINDPTFVVTVNDNSACTSVALSVMNAPAPGAFTYFVFDAGTTTQRATGPGAGAALTTAALPAGTYDVQVVETGTGCISSDLGVVITQLAQTPFSTTNNVCLASPTIVGAGSGVSYTFLGADAPSTAIIQNATSSVLTLNNVAGTYNYNVTADNGTCPNTQAISITLDGNITPAITQSDPCQTTVVLSAAPATGGYSYQWYRNSVLDVALLGQQVSLTAPDNNIQFRVDVVSSVTGCTYSSPTLTVSVVGPVTAAISSTPACDDGSPFTITATTSATSPTYTWSRDIGGGFVIITGETASTTAQTAEGIYKITVSQGTCNAEAQIQLLKAPLPIGSLPDRVIICDDPENADPATDHYDLDPGVFTAYDWWIKQTADAPEVNLGYTDQVYTAERKAFHYRVELTNTFGCKSSDYTEVLNDCVPKLYAPNAFRPASGVPLNKVFAVQSYFITDEFKVFIFNRWGELVYQSDDRYFQWNGGREGDATIPLPSGAYAYVIQYVSTFRPDEGVQEKRGGVMLLR